MEMTINLHVSHFNNIENGTKEIVFHVWVPKTLTFYSMFEHMPVYHIHV